MITQPDLPTFLERHRSALARSPARHTIPLSILEMAKVKGPKGLYLWSFGQGSACALKAGAHNIVLCDVTEAQCEDLANATATLDYPGVIGPDRTGEWFTRAARRLGIAFDEPMPQRIHKLDAAPRFPGTAGAVRTMDADDADLLEDWVGAFIREAVPHDPAPSRAAIEAMATSGLFQIWEIGHRPVSMAAIVRETAGVAAISMVYTPPVERGRGFGGSATAATVELAFERGNAMACLFTDLRNPFSNRCYARIGFEPVCDASFHARVREANAAG